MKRPIADRLLAVALVAVLACCSPRPEPVNPALWKVQAPSGAVAYLFGTIHSAPRPLAWKTAKVAAALSDSRSVMVEVSNLADENQVAATFARLAHSPGHPPLSQRVSATDRPALLALMKKAGYSDGDFARIKTWAAALMLAKAGQGSDDGSNGVDRAVIAAAPPRPVVELEGAARQLGLFDSLSEQDQRDLLAAIVREASGKPSDISALWGQGDMDALTAETRKGMLADPDLRAVLFTGRNTQWAKRITQAMAQKQRPFVAVGAAHMAGPQGLPAILAAQGFAVRRIE